MANILALDIETTGLNPRRHTIHGIGVAGDACGCQYMSGEFMKKDSWLGDWLANPANHIVGHNIRFDLKFLTQAGWTIRCNWWDTKVLAQLIDENRELGLKALTMEYFGKESLTSKHSLDSVIGKARVKNIAELCRADLNDPTHPHLKIIGDYCMEDCVNTLRLWNVMSAKLKEIHAKMQKAGFEKTVMDYYLEEAMPIEKLLLRMELRGIQVDVPAMKEYRNELAKTNRYHENQLNELAAREINEVENLLYIQALRQRKSAKGKANVQKRSAKHKTLFNWQSDEHLRTLVFEAFDVPAHSVDKTSSGKPSTSESSLARIIQNVDAVSPIATILQTFAKWKKNLKLLNTYTGGKKGLLAQVDNGRIYADYLQAGRGKEGTKGGTVTGRLSSRSPNMQNLPGDSPIKSFFKPDEGFHFIYFDYSQLEFRIIAHLSQDPKMIEAYQSGSDLHTATADLLNIERKLAKNINFAMLYGAGAYRLSQMLGETVEYCDGLIKDFYAKYSGYAKYMREQQKFMLRNGFVVSMFGRVRRLPELITEKRWSKHWKHALKQGYNAPVQGPGASITKRTMLRLWDAGEDVVTQVHDSVICQVLMDDASAEYRIREIAENTVKLSVPLIAETKRLTSLAECDILK